jgi:hypothetical protein
MVMDWVLFGQITGYVGTAVGFIRPTMQILKLTLHPEQNREHTWVGLSCAGFMMVCLLIAAIFTKGDLLFIAHPLGQLIFISIMVWTLKRRGGTW